VVYGIILPTLLTFFWAHASWVQGRRDSDSRRSSRRLSQMTPHVRLEKRLFLLVPSSRSFHPTKIELSYHEGTPKSSILIYFNNGFSSVNHPFWGNPIKMETNGFLNKKCDRPTCGKTSQLHRRWLVQCRPLWYGRLAGSCEAGFHIVSQQPKREFQWNLVNTNMWWYMDLTNKLRDL